MGVIKINTKKSPLLLSRIAPLTFPSPNLDFKAPRKKQDTECRISWQIYLYFKEVSQKAS